MISRGRSSRLAAPLDLRYESHRGVPVQASRPFGRLEDELLSQVGTPAGRRADLAPQLSD